MMNEPASEASLSSGATMDRRIERKRLPWWRQRRVLTGSAVLMAALVLWRLLPAGGSTDMAAADLDTGTVQNGRFDDSLPLRASVAPRVTTLVSAMTGGQVERLMVQDGTLVTKGQPLALLTNPELKLEVLTREAAITSQLGQLTGEDLALERSRLDRAGQTAAASYDLLKAKRELAIRQQLHDMGFVSDAGVRSYHEEEDYQTRRLAGLTSGQSAENRTASQQASRLAQARAELEANRAAVRAGLDALVIRAPVAGRLTNFALQAGQMLKVGDTAGQVDSEGSWKLIADVDEFYLGRVVVGQKASAGDMRLTVSRVLPSVTNGRFRIELTFDAAPPSGLNRGQTIDARVTLGAAQQALLAPVGSWLESGGGTSAFVLDADGRHARRTAIRIGRRNSDVVEVLSGLSPGARIITSNTAAIKGDIINIR